MSIRKGDGARNIQSGSGRTQDALGSRAGRTQVARLLTRITRSPTLTGPCHAPDRENSS